MKKTSYIGKTKEDLIKALTTKREEFRKMRFGVTGSKARDVKSGAVVKKDIARIMTELNRPEK